MIPTTPKALRCGVESRRCGFVCVLPSGHDGVHFDLQNAAAFHVSPRDTMSEPFQRKDFAVACKEHGADCNFYGFFASASDARDSMHGRDPSWPHGWEVVHIRPPEPASHSCSLCDFIDGIGSHCVITPCPSGAV